MANNKISSSKREIYTKMLDIAEKYTDIKNTDFLKTGLFGYMTETMAMMMRDSTFHKSMMYNESFLNTAVLPKSVYNWAKMFNIEVQKATPKYATINIVIPTSSLHSSLKKYTTLETKYGIKDSNLKNKDLLILDRDDPILAGDYYFSLERSIMIRKKTDETYSAEYIMSEPTKTNFEILNNSNLIVKENNSNLVITARAYQYQTTNTIFKITTTSFLNKIHKVKFDDQFCGASLFYEEYNGSFVEIPLYYSDMKKNVGPRCAFYNLTDSNELEIIFKNGDGYFMPSANTNLKISVYTTKAEKAPLVYTGDALMLFKDSDLKSLPLIIQFNPSNLIGGKNQPDLSTIKQTIIREISTRDVITTQSDLNNFFAILMSFIEDVNDGKIKFIKKRDDIVKRSFNSYLLLRDNTNNEQMLEETGVRSINAVIPTNTLDVSIGEKMNGIDHYDLNYEKFNYNGELLENSDFTSDFYISPFLISITNGTYRFVKYIYNMTDSSADVIIKNPIVSEKFNSLYIVPSSARLFRGFNEGGTNESMKPNKYYKLYITTTTNQLIGVDLDNLNDPALKYNGSITISEYSGKNEIESIKITSENIDVYGHKLEGNTYETVFEIKIPVDDKEFYYNDTDRNSSKYYNKINLNGDNGVVPFSSSARISIDFNEFKLDSNDLTGFKLETTSNLVFFEHLDNYMESAIITEGTGENEKIVGLKDVPLVHSSFFNHGDNISAKRENFVKQLFTYIEILKSNIERLETTSFFNIKFYNTYGLSNLYYTDTTNLQLDLNIVIDKQYQNKKDSLEAQIRSYIRKLVDKMNEKEIFNLTDIISSVANDSTYGKYIKYIKFIGLNGTFNQYINRLSGEELVEGNYTPEWLNIDYESLMSEIPGEGIFFTYE